MTTKEEAIKKAEERRTDSNKDHWVHGLDYWVHRTFAYPQTDLYIVYAESKDKETPGELVRILDYGDGTDKSDVEDVK